MVAQLGAARGEWLSEILEGPPDPRGGHHHVHRGQADRLRIGSKYSIIHTLGLLVICIRLVSECSDHPLPSLTATHPPVTFQSVNILRPASAARRKLYINQLVVSLS